MTGEETGQDPDYQKRLGVELENYRDQENVHDLPAIAAYWAEKFLVPMARQFGYTSVNAFYCDYVKRVASSSEGRLFLCSVGAGNCDTEIRLLKTLRESGITEVTLECIELNETMLDRGRRQDAEFVNRDCSVKSFEGVRAQDILSLLMKYFGFDFFLAYANVIDVFIDRGFGPNFDPDNPEDTEFIDRVHAIDQRAMEEGRIKPTHLTAAMTLQNVSGDTRYYKHLTPAFCLREPE